MNALYRMKKGSIKYTYPELWAVAQVKLGKDYIYCRAPYPMAHDEFMGHYSKYWVILPHEPSKEELIEGIFNPSTKGLMIKFWSV